MKVKIFSLILACYLACGLHAQDIKVLTLGTFHFNFPNLDIEKIDKKDQIDVLAPQYQQEILELVNMIAKFEPSIIAIEVSPDNQSRTDSLYREYLAGNYTLGRDEHEQIGFRLAKLFRLDKLYCTNDWGLLPENIDRVLNGHDSIENRKFMDYFYLNPDSNIYYDRKSVFKTRGIIEEIRLGNDATNLQKDLGNYLINIFKYETKEDTFFGVDFTTGWWFNRNLRIFRNIQRIPQEEDDRILVIYGAGHMNILNILFDASPEYDLLDVKDYLN